jgi:hypothetical protein
VRSFSNADTDVFFFPPFTTQQPYDAQFFHGFTGFKKVHQNIVAPVVIANIHGGGTLFINPLE